MIRAIATRVLPTLAAIKTEDLKARHVALLKRREELFAEEPSAEVVDLRKRRVDVKLALKKRVVPELVRELDESEKKHVELTKETAEQRAAVKAELRAIEAELASRDLIAQKAAFDGSSTEELEETLRTNAEHIREVRATSRVIQAVLDDRAATKRVRELAAGLSPAEKVALAEQLKKDGS